MNKKEFLLQILQEECAELIQTASKINRFGLDFKSGTKDVDNKTDFIIELNDVFCTLYMMNQEGMFDKDQISPNPDLMKKKYEKTIKYMDVSRALGHLE